ncbi:type III-B CRISPR module RAMP protein Cmr4 [Leptolyngbya sp. 'hensonii']|uniref:type III-B CRISPR module RAMP protein Cmr4 n=1 Tax=Leptolyngbya sp. 'hensonii' TaxID=1922337 RepID=UPI00094F6844|nr:type III-B CRISPR module RAMP protein Cmr4 [Leptolyngbya sp. 'hensonii']OLP16754.1 type III-B CRISPR module RAMP protein Cmr4 [Leptolyngbya sp. 'hensonii']
MYQKAYGIIETLAPLHVGATAGEESGNLNLIFRDQFTQTGIIPGSSIRGRFRSEMRRDLKGSENEWYGAPAETGESDSTTESIVKFEYASLLWLPVFCPGQPVVWVSSPKLLKRYQRIVGGELKDAKIPTKYTGSSALKPLNVEGKKKLFFNFGFLELKETTNLKAWFPSGEELPAVIVGDDEIGMIHDMALYRQSRVRLKDDEKRVDGGGFFNTEALPEGTIMVFPIAIRETDSKTPWKPFGEKKQSGEIYLGGLESIGFGNCQITIKGEGVAA